MEGAHVCRHSDGGTAVPADQFGEQTYIRRGKGAGGLRGISTNAEQVAVWVGSFSVCAHLDLAIEAMYCHEDAGEKPFGGTEGECKMENNHKEEDERRRKMDETDRSKIAEELEKHSHPLNVKSTDLYNIGRTNKSECPRCTSHRQHSKREVHCLASWRIPQQNREESEDYAGNEEGCYRERQAHI